MKKLTVAVNAEDHVQGEDNAPCTLLEYGDYQCPSCAEAFVIVKRVQKHFGKRLRFVFRNFPLEMHPCAERAAEAAEFAATEDKFWEMHDALYDNQDRLDDELPLELGKELDLDVKLLEEDLEAETFEPRVHKDFESGVASGVQGTPTFYLDGVRHDGSYDYESLVEAIDHCLKK